MTETTIHAIEWTRVPSKIGIDHKGKILCGNYPVGVGKWQYTTDKTKVTCGRCRVTKRFRGPRDLGGLEPYSVEKAVMDDLIAESHRDLRAPELT